MTKNRLRIAQVPSLWSRIPPRTYGGVERRVDNLSKELLRRGHAVTLFASADSTTPSELYPITAMGLTDAMAKGEAFYYEHFVNHCIAQVLKQSDRFDIIHFHFGSVAIPLSILCPIPTLHTLQMELTSDDAFLIAKYPEVKVNALSHRQGSVLPVETRERIPVIYNGLDFDKYKLARPNRDYLVFLGRIAPHKGRM